MRGLNVTSLSETHLEKKVATELSMSMILQYCFSRNMSFILLIGYFLLYFLASLCSTFPRLSPIILELVEPLCQTLVSVAAIVKSGQWPSFI
jgi:hypothetical protein